MLIKNLQKYRKEVEDVLREVLLSNIIVYQLALSASACRCIGLNLFPYGIHVEDLEVIKDDFLSFFKKKSYDFGVFPKNISYQWGENFEIVQLKTLSTCERCNFEYKGVKMPWPDVYVIENLMIKKDAEGDAKNLLLYRGEVEEKLRILTKRLIYITELGAFSLKCGCKGLTASIRGLKKGYIKHFPFFNEIAKNIGLATETNSKRNAVYGRTGHGSSEILRITSRELCERCKKRRKGLSLRNQLIPLLIQENTNL